VAIVEATKQIYGAAADGKTARRRVYMPAPAPSPQSARSPVAD